MGLTRLIILVAFIWVAWFLLKRFQLKLIERKEKASEKKQPVTNVKECAYCGVHVLEAEAFENEGHYFCSDSHLRSYKLGE